MKTYTFIEPLHNLETFTVEVYMNEEEVLDHYWEWHKQGMEASGKVPSKELCLDEFCHNHFAVACEAHELGFTNDGTLRLDYEMWKHYIDLVNQDLEK